jgi:hypothetical protein
MARIHPDLDLITDAHIGSNGSEEIGRSGDGVGSPKLVSAVACGLGSPELGVPAAPGAKSTRAWVGRDLRDTCDPRRAKARHGEGSSDEHDGGGSLARRRNDGARVPASGAAYGLRQLAQKEQGMEEELTKGL